MHMDDDIRYAHSLRTYASGRTQRAAHHVLILLMILRINYYYHIRNLLLVAVEAWFPGRKRGVKETEAGARTRGYECV